MKKQFLFSLILMITLFSTNMFAADTYTKTSFLVPGNCDMCKSRIEKAAKTEGVKGVLWNEETHVLTVAFVPTKISVDQIQQNISKAGYDTPKFKADSTAYEKLPKCCQYTK